MSDPEVDELTLTEPTRSSLLSRDAVDFDGPLVGGCIKVLSPLTRTPYGDVPPVDGGAGGATGLLEAAEVNAVEVTGGTGRITQDLARGRPEGLKVDGGGQEEARVLGDRPSAVG